MKSKGEVDYKAGIKPLRPYLKGLKTKNIESKRRENDEKDTSKRKREQI